MQFAHPIIEDLKRQCSACQEVRLNEQSYLVRQFDGHRNEDGAEDVVDKEEHRGP